MRKTPCCDKSGLKKGIWTQEEDRKLVAYVTRYGCWNWSQIPKFACLSRCGKSCRLRWMNYLRPDVKRGNYSKEEDDTIIKLHESLGNRWSTIAARLPGRTDKEIKNHWHANLKKRFEQNSLTYEEDPNSNNLISLCEKSQKETNNSLLINPATPQIINSSPLSPQASSIEFSSMITDTAIVTRTNTVDANIVSSLEAYVETNGSFWTEPFLTDNSPQASSSEFPSMITDTAVVTSTNIMDDNIVSSLEAYVETDGSFWTELFLTDNSPQAFSNEFPSMITDNAVVTSTNIMDDNIVSSSEVYAETSDSFWTAIFDR